MTRDLVAIRMIAATLAPRHEIERRELPLNFAQPYIAGLFEYYGTVAGFVLAYDGGQREPVGSRVVFN